MTSKNTEELISLYPQMFAGYRAVLGSEPSFFEKLYNRGLFYLQIKYPYFRKFKHKKSKNPYDFKFECADGWAGILSQLILDIKELDEKTGVVTEINFVRRKDGGLKIYPLNGAADDVWKLLIKYTEKSLGVCEYTGHRKNIGFWTYGDLITMSFDYAYEHYIILSDSGKVPYGMTLNDCWKAKEASKTIVINKK